MNDAGVAAARVAAWQALSNLFIDSTLDAADIAAIARELRATGFGIDELERIYEEEVAPVCWRNLHALPGGVWTGFDPAWLAEAVTRARHRPPPLHALPFVRRLRIRRWTRLTRDDWLRVRKFMEEQLFPDAQGQVVKGR